MQSNSDIIRSYFFAIDHSNFEKAGQFLADDFRKIGPTGSMMGKQETLETLGSLKTAMPDLSHALSSIEAEGAIVRLTVQAGGRHMNTLNLPEIGMGIPSGTIPASGRMIIFLPNQYEYMVVNSKIVSEKNVTPSTLFNGVTGFLNALGYAA